MLVLGAFALYVATLAPSVMPGDYAEFQFSAAILGVPHPTGYPLYILLGNLFTMLPVGDVAYRVNLSSAVYMAGAVGMLYALGVKLLRLLGWGRAWWAAAVGAALFAVSPTPWSMSLVARSYALNALLVGCVLFALIVAQHAAYGLVQRLAPLHRPEHRASRHDLSAPACLWFVPAAGGGGEL